MSDEDFPVLGKSQVRAQQVQEQKQQDQRNSMLGGAAANTGPRPRLVGNLPASSVWGRPKVDLQPKSSDNTTPQVLETKKSDGFLSAEEGHKPRQGAAKGRGKGKPQPTGNIGLSDFLGAAMRKKNKKKEKGSEKLQVQHRQSQKAKNSKKKGPNSSAIAATKGSMLQNPNQLDSTTKFVRKGKSKAPGHFKKKKLSTLKKRLHRDRRLRWFLICPDLRPIPLQVHPAMHDYVFLDLSGKETIAIDPVEFGSIEEQVTQYIDKSLPKDNTSESSSLDESEAEEEEGEEEDTSFVNDVWDVTKNSPIFFGCPVAPKSQMDGEDEVKMVAQDAAAEQTRVQRRKGLQTKMRNSLPVREYVDQALSDEMDELVTSMLSRLMELQERIRLKDPVKAQMRRRLVFGFREVIRGIRSRRCACVIVAPNIEQGLGKDTSGIDGTVKEMLEKCAPTEDEIELGKEGVPVVFALNKSKLGKALNKRIKVSTVGIYSADGAYEEYKKILALRSNLRAKWTSVVAEERMNEKFAICSDCGEMIAFVRYDCTNCTKVRCRRCASSASDRKIPCEIEVEKEKAAEITRKLKRRQAKEGDPAEASESTKPEEKARKPCQLLRIPRSIPEHLKPKEDPKLRRKTKRNTGAPSSGSRKEKKLKLNSDAPVFVPKFLKQEG